MKYKCLKFLLIVILILCSIACKHQNTKEIETDVLPDSSVIVEVELEPLSEPKEEVKKINFEYIKINNEYITQPNNIKRKTPPPFMQGLYVTAYATNRSTFDSLLVNAKKSGINTIIFDVKEMQGDVNISLKDYPQIKYISSDSFLNINKVVEKIHSYGFYAVARMVQFYNINTAKEYPYLRPQLKEGGYWQEKKDANPAWLDPSHPLVQADLLHLIDIIANSNVDEIQMDYVRFPTEGKISNAVFYYELEDEYFLKSDSTYVKREKRDVIRDYVKEVRKVCDRHNVRISADIFAIVAWQRSIDIKNTGQDIAYMSPHLHHLHPMIYSSHFSDGFIFHANDFINKPYPIIKAAIEKTIKKMDKNCAVIPYLQAFGWRVNYNREYMYDQIKSAYDTDSKGYILWNAASSYNKALSWIKEWNNSRRMGLILEGYPTFDNLFDKIDFNTFIDSVVVDSISA